MIAVLNDLHKGRDSGAVWSAVIDISAGLLTFMSLTGLILIYYIHKHRLAGVILLVAGAALAGMLYMIGYRRRRQRDRHGRRDVRARVIVLQRQR